MREALRQALGASVERFLRLPRFLDARRWRDGRRANYDARQMLSSFRRWLADRLGVYRELPEYIKGVKKTAIQEILYGESVIATGFAAYTYAYSISLTSVVLVFAGSFVLAGYHIWRADHFRFVPKLKLAEPPFRLHDAATLDPKVERIYLQVLPQCATETPVEECRGYLLRIDRWENGWRATEYDHAINLTWSFREANVESVTIDPGVDKRLNVLWIDSQFRIAIETSPHSAAITKLMQATGPYRFAIRILAKDCSPIDLALKVDLGITAGRPIDWRETLRVESL